MSVSSKSTRGRNARVPISSLRLDAQNPRLPEDKFGEDQDELAVYMELAFDAYTVAESISAHGFFSSEPLIVMEDAGAYVVLEGNRRLTALLGLVDNRVRGSFANPGPWEELARQAGLSGETEIPVVIVSSRSDATPIVGFRHISGILQWQRYAQARYIASLVDDSGLTYGEVAEMIGIDRTRVANLYRDQAIVRQARELGIDTGPLEETFSLMDVAMSSPKLREHIGAPLGLRLEPGANPIDDENAGQLRELITWIYGDEGVPPVISESRHISKLGNVVATDVGLRALRDGESLEVAIQRTRDAETDPRQRLMSRLRAGRNSLTASLEDLADFVDDSDVVDAIEEIVSAVDAIRAVVDE